MALVPEWRAEHEATSEQGVETWIVVGAGLSMIGDFRIPFSGTWRVTTGSRIPQPLDGSAQLADDFK